MAVPKSAPSVPTASPRPSGDANGVMGGAIADLSTERPKTLLVVTGGNNEQYQDYLLNFVVTQIAPEANRSTPKRKYVCAFLNSSETLQRFNDTLHRPLDFVPQADFSPKDQDPAVNTAAFLENQIPFVDLDTESINPAEFDRAYILATEVTNTCIQDASLTAADLASALVNKNICSTDNEKGLKDIRLVSNSNDRTGELDVDDLDDNEFPRNRPASYNFTQKLSEELSALKVKDVVISGYCGNASIINSSTQEISQVQYHKQNVDGQEKRRSETRTQWKNGIKFKPQKNQDET